MKTLQILFLLASLFIYSNSIAQDDEYIYKKPSDRKQNKKAVTKAILKLKDGGAIIYIVKDRRIKTAMLKERGLEHKIAGLDSARIKKEKIIVKGFAANFKFCPIYFVLQSDVEKIQKGQIAGNLLDTSLTKSSAISFNHSYFLFLDYGDVYDEQGKVYCDTCKSDLTGKMSLKQDAFIFKNIHLSQLTKPFPYYQTCHYPAKEIVVKVKKMNSRLYKFYGNSNNE